MRPKDWFILGSRVLGLWQLFDAAEYTLSILNMIAGLSRPPAGYTVASYFTHTIGAFLCDNSSRWRSSYCQSLLS